MIRDPAGEELAAGLERKLAAIPEAPMRAVVLREQLAVMDGLQLYSLVDGILADPRPLSALREALGAFLFEGDPASVSDYALRAELYARASAAGDARVMELLRSQLPPCCPTESPPEAHLDLRDVPLGRRRSLARGRDSLLLEKLARDPDPVVIANLLENPRTTEDDVVRMAALRPVSPTTLLEIGHSPRWARRLRVRASLALNPACPLALALQQLHVLPLHCLREIACDPGLPEPLRAHAERELGRRGS